SLLRFEQQIVAAFPLAVLFLKPQELLPFAVFLLGAGRYKTLLVLLALGVGLAATSYELIGLQGYMNYADLMNFSMTHTQGMQPELSPTVRGQLLRLPINSALVMQISLGALAVALLLILFLGLQFKRRPGWLWAGLIGSMLL